MNAKYCVTVYSKDTNIKILSVITNSDDLVSTVKDLSDLGDVKAFILDDKKEVK